MDITATILAGAVVFFVLKSQGWTIDNFVTLALVILIIGVLSYIFRKLI